MYSRRSPPAPRCGGRGHGPDQILQVTL